MATREHRDARSRSRSPSRAQSHRHNHHHHRHGHRDRDRERHHHHHSSKHRSSDRDTHKPLVSSGAQDDSNSTMLPLPPRPFALPHQAVALSKHDLQPYRHMFASYLDIQKQLDMDAMDERQVKGRWKSFVSKWNRGELAEGWYDPATKTRADAAAAEFASTGTTYAESRQDRKVDHDSFEHGNDNGNGLDDKDDDSDSDYGPRPLARYATSTSAGPAGATFEDLALRDELVPRAAAGTRERQLEKRADAAASNRAFVADREAGVAEVADTDLLGAGGADELRSMRQEQQRRKTEKEVRREEQLRARAAEREERVRGLRAREEQTMAMFREVVRERYGGA